MNPVIDSYQGKFLLVQIMTLRGI